MGRLKRHLFYVPAFFIALVIVISIFAFIKFRGVEEINFQDLGFKILPVTQTSYTHNDTYPLLFVHGHSSRESEAIKRSLKAFDRYQEKLDYDEIYEGYGIIYPGEKKEFSDKGDWSNTTLPISVRTTYYVDLEEGKINKTYAFSSFEERNITEYANRLKKVIDTLTYRTNSKKVDIIAHSMGGLVVREYLRLYGDEKIGKIVMVGTPNKGVNSIVSTRLCNFANPSFECRQMVSGSSFLKGLNSINISEYDTKIMTVAGSCCKFCALCNGQDYSDQVVFTKNVAIEGAKNVVLNESKGQIDELHSELINPYLHDDVYQEVLKFLKAR